MPSRATYLLTAALFAGAAFAQSEVPESVRSYVSGHWSKICRMADKASEMRDELDELPEHSIWFWKQDKRCQRRDIRRHLQAAREILLSTDSRKILKASDKLDGKIADEKAAIDALRNERIVNPDKSETCDKKISEAQARISAYERQRGEIRKQCMSELRELGLNLTDEQADSFLCNVCSGSIIDNTIVAANIRAAVDNLRQLMQTGDVQSAKRYFGMYIVLVDVQMECFRQYLETSRDEWLPGVKAILDESREVLAEAKRNSASSEYTAEQRQIFRSNAELVSRTITAAETYAKMLTEQEKVVEKKLADAQKIRDVAVNSHKTVRLAGDFLAMMRTSNTSFDAILQMDLPQVFAFDDAALRDQFQAITAKLREK